MNHTITMDAGGILIDGSRRILLASSLFYFRIPREKWKSRMLLLKAAGYNTIDVYFPWNYHEASPGEWDFTGGRDAAYFLGLAAECGLWVIARPGPYICSEWDGGALPAWLSAQNVPVRQDDPAFLDRIGAWYEHILPVIASYQATWGGTVICMQIENELDFFDCKSPVSYMEKLMERARFFGVDVPLFYCCGQNDLLRAGGLTPGLVTAFNVYDNAGSAGLEKRALHLYKAAQERKIPFLVTETNREHSFLKRLFACGAKLLSPYNQTAGTTMDWYNGITNWGTPDSPIALMASDYDFDSMIGSAGEVNSQFYEARLLSGLFAAFGERLAGAVPCDVSGVTIRTDADQETDALLLKMEDGGFLEAVNTGKACTMQLSTDTLTIPLVMPALSAKLLPYRITLDSKRETVLEISNYEIAWIKEQEGKTVLGMYGDGAFHAVIRENGKSVTLEGAPSQTGAPASLTAGGVTILFGPASLMALRDIPGLPDMKIPVEDQQSGEAVSQCRTAPFFLLPSNKTGDASEALERECCLSFSQKPSAILPMEQLGQYRGVGCYSLYLDSEQDVLLINPADILTFYHNGVFSGLRYADGGCQRMVLSKGTHDIFTEIWGHSNFDDIRVKSLQMGSLKGLAGVLSITGTMDISDNWDFDLDEQPSGEWYFFRRSSYSTIMGIDSYNRAACPLRTVYDKWITVPDGAEGMFLHFSKADCVIQVYVNGRLEATVLKSDPYVDISRYADCKRVELCLRVQRRYYTDPVGEVTLITGRLLRSCLYGKAPVEQIALPDNARLSGLPIRLALGSQMLLSPVLPPSEGLDRKLFFKGRDLKLTAFADGHTIGRLVLENDVFPVVRGGCGDVLYLPAQYPSGKLVIWCQAIGPDPVLKSVRCCSYRPVV